MDIAERHLVSLWAAVRDAADQLRQSRGEHLAAPHLARLLHALAIDSRRLAELIEQGQESGHLPAVPAAGDRPAVLIVDDDATAVSAMRELLSDQFDVIATCDPADVTGLMEQQRVDALVTDLRMPGLDGLALLELIQAGERPPPVIIVSASLEPAVRREALERGAFDFVTKPVDIPELAARIHRAVRYARELDRERGLQLTDDLTGLPNRRAFNAALQALLADRRLNDSPLSVAFIDQNGLKRVNDAHGHAAGDRAIVAVARAIDKGRRGSDVIARLGGDEFAIAMPRTDAASADRVLQRIARELEATPLEVGGGEALPLSVSWGVAEASAPDRSDGGLALLSRADSALYAMKRGRLSSAPR